MREHQYETFIVTGKTLALSGRDFGNRKTGLGQCIFDFELRVVGIKPIDFVAVRTSAKRVERLATLGLSEAALARLSAPIGVDIGSKTPPEIAVAVAAELIAARVALRTHALQGEAIVTA